MPYNDRAHGTHSLSEQDLPEALSAEESPVEL